MNKQPPPKKKNRYLQNLNVKEITPHPDDQVAVIQFVDRNPMVVLHAPHS